MVCCNQIIGVDPYGSILAQPDELNVTDVTSYHVSHLYHCMHSVQYGYVVHFDLQKRILYIQGLCMYKLHIYTWIGLCNNQCKSVIDIN